MNVIETFLRLTGRTYPHGSEQELFGLLPDFLEHDEFGNRYIQIGENTTCMFTSHLDTATAQRADVVHVIDGGICKTDGKTILGADDKAGVTIMLWMIHHGIPGLYYFFLGEEVGCVGSKALANKLRTSKIEGISKVISFDRRGTDSVITYQASSRCCSDTFARALAVQLNKKEGFRYSIDPSGVWTDSAQFTKIYPECTNISVGYRSEHTCSESQDLDHLVKLAEACLQVDWESLPVERDPSVVDYGYSRWGYDDYNYGYYGGGSAYGYSSGSRYSGGRYGSGGGYKSTGHACMAGWEDTGEYKPKQNLSYFFDERFNHVSSVSFEKYNKKMCDIELCEERLEHEKDLISDLLESLDVDYSQFTWDGLVLRVKQEASSEVSVDRTELAEFIPDLDFWKQVLYETEKKDAWDDPWRDKSLVF